MEKRKMKELLKQMDEASDKELERANLTKPLFNSLHQAYGVLAEEIDEAKDNFVEVEKHLNDFFKCMRGDLFEESCVCCEKMKQEALLCAAEMIQVASMCQKAIDSTTTNLISPLRWSPTSKLNM